MSLQNWTSLSGSSYANPQLSKSARMLTPKMTVLNDLVEPAGDFYLGKKSGDSVACRVVGRISGTADTALGEFTPIPFVKPPIYEVTATVYRYGAAIAFTGEWADLDRLDVEDTNVKALTEYWARTLNKLIYTELVSGRSFTYVPTSTTAGTFLATGAVAATAAAQPGLFHMEDITRNLMKVNTPPADGANFITALSPTAYFGLLRSSDFVAVKKYASSGAEGLLKNEIGMVANHRIVVDNDVLDEGIGTSSLYGSGFVLGHDAIREIPVYPFHFRLQSDLGQDFANQRAIAFQALLGHIVTKDYSTHGEGTVCHITSA